MMLYRLFLVTTQIPCPITIDSSPTNIIRDTAAVSSRTYYLLVYDLYCRYFLSALHQHSGLHLHRSISAVNPQ